MEGLHDNDSLNPSTNGTMVISLVEHTLQNREYSDTSKITENMVQVDLRT